MLLGGGKRRELAPSKLKTQKELTLTDLFSGSQPAMQVLAHQLAYIALKQA